MTCPDCNREHDPAIRCPNYHAGMHPSSEPEPEQPRELTLSHIMMINMQRCEAWHQGDEPWSPERWVTAIVGELGEMANITKKLFRARDGSVGILGGVTIEELEKEQAKEWADTMLYMLLFAGYQQIDPMEALREVFNAKSEQLGFEQRL